MAEFKYEITERIAVLSQSPNGWERAAQYGELERPQSPNTTSATGRPTTAKWAKASASPTTSWPF